MPSSPVTLWKMPFPSSGTDSPRFGEIGRRSCEILIEGETLDGEPVACRLRFNGVEAFRVTYLSSLSLDMINAAYDRVVDLGDTPWLRDCSARAEKFWKQLDEDRELRHLEICFDDGPCFEFLCVSFDPMTNPSDAALS